MDERTSKLDLLNETVDSLQAENKVLQEKLKEGVLAEKQLEIARKMINGMQRKKDVNESPAKKQILIFQQQVDEYQKYESPGRNDMVKEKLRALENMELEVLALKRENKEIELDKREVGIKLATSEEIIKRKEKMVTKIRKEITGLRHVNEELSEQFERLQRNRFDMVQELVYQRWLFTCMRFEAHQRKQSRKVSRDDFIRSSEKTLCKEIEAPTSDPELDSISSSDATFCETDEIDTTTTSESSSSSQSNSNKNSSLLHRIKKWKRRGDDSKEISPKGGFLKGNSASGRGLIRRFSMSMVLENLSMPRMTSNDNGNSEIKTTQETDKQNYSSKAWASPITPRLKRVSFNDSIKPSIYVYMRDSFSDPSDDNDAKLYSIKRKMNW